MFLSQHNCPCPPTENYCQSHKQYHPYQCFHQRPAKMHHHLSHWNQYHCFRLCPKIHYYQNLTVNLSFHCDLTSLKYQWFLIHSCYMRPCLQTEIPTHLQRRILYSTVPHCTADRNEHVCSLCYNQQVLSNPKTVAQITPCMQAPYKTLVYVDGLKYQAHLMAAGIFYFTRAFKFWKFSVLEINSINLMRIGPCIILISWRWTY